MKIVKMKEENLHILMNFNEIFRKNVTKNKVSPFYWKVHFMKNHKGKCQIDPFLHQAYLGLTLKTKFGDNP